MTSTDPTTTSAQSFRSWSRAMPLAQSLARAEAAVRAKPQDSANRWFLFELLCVLGQWERASKQLQAWASHAPESDGLARLMRGLIAAEVQRCELVAGQTPGGPVHALDTPLPGWMAGLGRALQRVNADDAAATEASDAAREDALAQAPETPGDCDLQPGFGWITDSDTRFGPVCEVVLDGAYRWLAFADIASLTKAAPATLIDLVWGQVDIVLRGGPAAVLKAHMPMRYPVQQPGERDAVLLARETLWHDVGRSGVFARGQKVWMTDAGDIALLDLRGCDFGADAAASHTSLEQVDAAAR